MVVHKRVLALMVVPLLQKFENTGLNNYEDQQSICVMLFEVKCYSMSLPFMCWGLCCLLCMSVLKIRVL